MLSQAPLSFLLNCISRSMQRQKYGCTYCPLAPWKQHGESSSQGHPELAVALSGWDQGSKREVHSGAAKEATQLMTYRCSHVHSNESAENSRALLSTCYFRFNWTERIIRAGDDGGFEDPLATKKATELLASCGSPLAALQQIWVPLQLTSAQDWSLCRRLRAKLPEKTAELSKSCWLLKSVTACGAKHFLLGSWKIINRYMKRHQILNRWAAELAAI